MKKYLMGLSILIFCASAYGEVIDLGEKNIYSETGFEKNLRNSTTSPFIITSTAGCNPSCIFTPGTESKTSDTEV